MPPKKKKAGKGKTAKKKKDTPEDQNKTTCNRFLKSYIKHCNEQSVLSCAAILQECRRCMEEDQLINKVWMFMIYVCFIECTSLLIVKEADYVVNSGSNRPQ